MADSEGEFAMDIHNRDVEMTSPGIITRPSTRPSLSDSTDSLEHLASVRAVAGSFGTSPHWRHWYVGMRTYECLAATVPCGNGHSSRRAGTRA